MNADPPTPDPAELLPPPPVLRQRLAKAQREVDILSGLLRLAERVSKREGREAGGHATPGDGTPRPTRIGGAQ